MRIKMSQLQLMKRTKLNRLVGLRHSNVEGVSRSSGELVLDDVEARDRAQFYRNVSETQTRTIGERDLVVLDAFDAFDPDSQ
jgi:hypothetical protein